MLIFRKDRVLLREDVNCIPKGCYKFLEKSGDMLYFSVGKKIVIGVSDDASYLMEKQSPAAFLTRPEEFLIRYYFLLEQQECRPRTMCSIDPSMLKELENARVMSRFEDVQF